MSAVPETAGRYKGAVMPWELKRMVRTCDEVYVYHPSGMVAVTKKAVTNWLALVRRGRPIEIVKQGTRYGTYLVIG